MEGGAFTITYRYRHVSSQLNSPNIPHSGKPKNISHRLNEFQILSANVFFSLVPSKEMMEPGSRCQIKRFFIDNCRYSLGCHRLSISTVRLSFLYASFLRSMLLNRHPHHTYSARIRFISYLWSLESKQIKWKIELFFFRSFFGWPPKMIFRRNIST